MKKIIDGKTYNTETAEFIRNYSNGLGNRDFRNLDEDLYITKKGAFFLSGSGGAMTKYSEPCGNMTGGGEGVIALTNQEALDWLEDHGSTEDIEAYLPGLIEEA